MSAPAAHSNQRAIDVRVEPATPSTTTAADATTVAPIWLARARSGRLLSRPPTMLTVLTQTPAFVSGNRSGAMDVRAGPAAARPCFLGFSKIDAPLAAICVAVAKGQTIGPA
jgi:hypothetical protein